jgi:predicted nuclease of predicted toxin-antitoxin system
MRILLDECIPKKLRNSLATHECRSVHDEGWSGKKNGELLTPAKRSGIQVFITIDRGIEYQQNLKPRSIAVLLIRTKSNRLVDLLPQVPEILKVLGSVQPGQLTKVGQ